MSVFPDCRNDDVYNERFLCEKDKAFVEGADWMLEQIACLFNDNLDVYELEYDGDIDIDKVLEKASGEIVEMISDWAEMERNMMITSMIDGMPDEEFEKNRKEVLAKDSDSLYNTRKYMCAGLKRRTEE